MKKQKMQLSDLDSLSRATAEQRISCLRRLAALPLGVRGKDVQAIILEECPSLLEEIILEGARVLVARTQAKRATVVDIDERRVARSERIARLGAPIQEIVHRVEIGSRVVELLDSIQINGKMLGDCTRSEVTAEADRDARRSEALAERANWLRSLADILQPNQTVRTADRHAVLAILQEAP